ncbi:hypothetical protein K402DRAFT_390216 [Aulographum hederae CBS 113979]|uniref:Heat shock factor binding protein 1 n=1 Tax=Aulographum hederae CBS 113979 TaxID=1176131 RepID=A0A6G1H9I6_9PEZI|nr:hypothetical protein K402DRAFT_390216 [Aulographum hederae CBS 113979]
MSDPRNSSDSTGKANLETTDTGTATSELSNVVDELLTQLSTKFSTISGDLLAKMDDMSKRLDNLEATIQSQARNNDQGK